MTNKRILHIVNSFNVGGMENGVVNLINHSDERRTVHGVCALRGIGSIGNRVLKDSARLFSLGDNENKVNRTAFFGIYRIIREFEPDVIHVRHWGPLWDTVLAHLLTLRRSKLVFSFHGKTYREYQNTSWLINIKRRALLKFTTSVVTLNEHMNQTLKNEINIKKKIVIIPNGVDTTKFSPSNNKDKLREELGLPNDVFIFGMVGRLSKIKNIETILNACSILRKKISGFKIVIVGDGEERVKLNKCVLELGLDDIVHFVGNSQSVDKYLKCFDVYVQASLYEGFSNTILEAISSGLPAIVTDVGGNSFLVRDGFNGFLFSSGDYSCLAKQMYKMCSERNTLNIFSDRSRSLAVEKWSIENMINSYERFYSNL